MTFIFYSSFSFSLPFDPYKWLTISPYNITPDLNTKVTWTKGNFYLLKNFLIVKQILSILWRICILVFGCKGLPNFAVTDECTPLQVCPKSLLRVCPKLYQFTPNNSTLFFLIPFMTMKQFIYGSLGTHC